MGEKTKLRHIIGKQSSNFSWPSSGWQHLHILRGIGIFSESPSCPTPSTLLSTCQKGRIQSSEGDYLPCLRLLWPSVSPRSLRSLSTESRNTLRQQTGLRPVSKLISLAGCTSFVGRHHVNRVTIQGSLNVYLITTFLEPLSSKCH